MKLSKKYTTVTPTSKAFALALFITLPIAAFLFGAKWQQIRDSYLVSDAYEKAKMCDRVPSGSLRPRDYQGEDTNTVIINGTPMSVGL